ncbi:hypothetical protein Bca101_058630 [Brassica carinata]
MVVRLEEYSHTIDWTCLSLWASEHVEMLCEPSRPSFSSGESDDISEAVFPSEAEIHYKRLFSLREQGEFKKKKKKKKAFVSRLPTQTLSYQIFRCRSISKWICAFAHHHRLDIDKFVGIKEEAEEQLEGWILGAVASASTKMREVELLACTKKTRKSYDNMVARLRWEAAW